MNNSVQQIWPLKNKQSSNRQYLRFHADYEHKNSLCRCAEIFTQS